MQLPETPTSLRGLDLMKRLVAYQSGQATWYENGREVGPREQAACQQLNANLTNLVEKCLHPLMDRVTAREMQGFTMHDRYHGLKVAHLMWHALLPARRVTLSPVEIALLVTSAHLHDLGMGLSDRERSERLSPSSSLWDTVDPDSEYAKALSQLTDLAQSGTAGGAITHEALYQVQQAQEALLCLDCRERHATRARYRQILDTLGEFHKEDPIRISDPLTALSFDGDSFEDKLIEICVSHNEDAHVLTDPDPTNIEQFRFPTQYPVGCCVADTRMVAAALRLADILDFDRERTPAVLFHYILPQSDDPRENMSVREWSKHLAISNWQIESERIVFRGRSPSAFIHHVIIEFCHTIEDEIRRTKSTYLDEEWPFTIRPSVVPAIEASGYRYMPYRFSLDEQRVYDLLMGKNIYRNKLDAVRELIQNAVDACKLRDNLMQSYDGTVTPSKVGRIKIIYEEPKKEGQAPRLSVIDKGAGMDRYIIENFFLKVGRSYYKSSEFLRTRSFLRKKGFDFAPIAEFGIGVMAVFMLGDRIEVETAPWSPSRKDSYLRRLWIDGVGRLIEVRETDNSELPRFYGTRVTVQLTSRKASAPGWEEVKVYIENICKNLDFSLTLEHVTAEGCETFEVEPEGLNVPVPPHLASTAIKIPVDDPNLGLKGEIVFYRAPESSRAQAAMASETPMELMDRPIEPRAYGQSGTLLRGGFAVGTIPGLPSFILAPKADGRVEVSRSVQNARSLPITDLARSRLSEQNEIQASIFKTWLTELLAHLDEIERRPIGDPTVSRELFRSARWLQELWSAHDLFRLALTGWPFRFKDPTKTGKLFDNWEKGEGSSLWAGDSYGRSLTTVVFDMILPKITSIVVGENANYFVRPPKTGWQEALRNWHSFVSEGLSWPIFADYTRPNENYLYDSYSDSNFLNKRFETIFDGFPLPEIESIPALLGKLTSARGTDRRAQFSQAEIGVLMRLLDAGGHLIVRRFGETYTVRELVKGKASLANTAVTS
ncbi:hypothetical protein V1282_003593 [Nitrobacteraceae bacterium AZCC 2146]